MMEELDDSEPLCCTCCQSPNLKSAIHWLLLGQVLSLCLCATGVSSQLLSQNFSVHTPAAQTFANYFFLCFVYGTLLSCRNSEHGLVAVFRNRGWKYLLIALLDVEANYLIVYAYQYTNLTSIQILDCFTIPVVLVLSWLCLSVRYLISHILGVCVCLCGVGCLIYADMQLGKGYAGSSNRLLGDCLCLAAASLYAVSNVCEEFFVKAYNRIEYLGMIGLFGSVISGIQLSVLERTELNGVQWHDYRIVLLYLLFAASMFVFYSLVSVFIQKTSATMFNLSILTADLYSLILGLYVFDYKFHLLYILAFGLVVIGMIVYSWRATHKREGESGCRCCPNRSEELEELEQYNQLPGSSLPGPSTAQINSSQPHHIKYCPVHGPVVTNATQNL